MRTRATHPAGPGLGALKHRPSAASDARFIGGVLDTRATREAELRSLEASPTVRALQAAVRTEFPSGVSSWISGTRKAVPLLQWNAGAEGATSNVLGEAKLGSRAQLIDGVYIGAKGLLLSTRKTSSLEPSKLVPLSEVSLTSELQVPIATLEQRAKELLQAFNQHGTLNVNRVIAAAGWNVAPPLREY